MKEYTYFSSKNLMFKDINDKMVFTPEFVKRSAKNYRYDHNRHILQKKCIGCNKYFDVQEYRDGQFFDSHQELDIHYYSENSGYSTRCNNCIAKHNSEKEKVEYSADKYQIDETLSDENKMYVRIVAAIDQQTENECLNSILDLVRKHN